MGRIQVDQVWMLPWKGSENCKVGPYLKVGFPREGLGDTK
jgi:hypothetical protein